MTRLISWNVNGIRACIRKGFWEWLDSCGADVVCLQESKITLADFEKIALEQGLIPLTSPQQKELALTATKNKKSQWHYAISAAQKAGYSGVVVLTKKKPKSVVIGLGKDEFDSEGRSLTLDFGRFSLLNVYVPNGGRDLKRIPYKMAFSDHMLKTLQKMRKKQKNLVICGDMNVAHTEQDIKNAKSNVNNSGFTQIERDWFSKFLDHGYVDSFRHLHPNTTDQYSWWSYRPGVRQKNIGWRIDYFVVTKEFTPKIKNAAIHMEQMGSDHCPVELVLK